MLLENRVALVTGASRGIGAATAKLLAAEGAAVGVNYANNRDAGQAVVDEIEKAGGRAVLVQADVTVPEQVQAMVDTVRGAFGEIDIAVLNAGLNFPVTPFVQSRWEDFEPKLVGEVKSAFHCCKAVVPSMIERRGGNIVVISSTLSRHADTGFLPHCTTKSGLDAFVRSLATELGSEGIRINTIAPGLTNTDATAFIPEDAKAMMGQALPMRRIGEPEDVAGAVLMMVCDHARYITGAYMPVAGGGLMI
ncbi:MAG TPA: SDR family oxidoreductase [Candidatus Krumholzibacteria bacterium]|nr:SDR family oxidoreductase [Candidatus Krumholzibacteria bacterium]